MRLMYEANPLGFVVEQAGGAATNGRQRILDVVPTQLHERTPLILGNSDVVDSTVALMNNWLWKVLLAIFVSYLWL